MIVVLINSLIGGGAERIALTILEGLNAGGKKTLLICLEKESHYPIPPDQEVIFLSDYRKLWNPFFKVYMSIICGLKLRRIVRSRNVSLVQSHLIRSNVINNLAKIFGSPHKSQIVSHGPLQLGKSRIIRFLKKFLYRNTYRRSDQLISISKLMKYTLEKELDLAGLELNHIVIPNPHNIAVINEQSKKPVSNFVFREGVTYLMSIGRLTRLKKVDTTLEALAALRSQGFNIDFIIIGQGIDRPYLETVTNELNLNDHVHFIGQIANPFSFLAKADVLILSSAGEGLPNIIIEAMACGTPIISSDCMSGPREILSPESDYMFELTDKIEIAPYGILYPVNRMDLLVDSIQLILKDKVLRNRFKEDGLLQVQKYKKDKILKIYLSQIDSIIQS